MTSLPSTPALDELTVTIVVDNATDTLSSIAPGMPQLPEIAYLLGGVAPTGQHDGHNCVVAFDQLCVACHGFSALATARRGDRTATVLFDVGPYGDVWLANAQRLNVDLSSIDVLFLSHWHWDHSGGITTVVAAIATARGSAGRPPLVVDVHPDRPDQRGILTPLDVFAMLPPEPTLEAIQTAGGNVVTHADMHVVAELFLASGDIPRQTSYETGLPGHHTWRGGQVTLDTGIHDERCLAANVRGRGTTALTACSHAGVVNVGLETRRLLPDQPIDLLLGGYHLAGATVEDRIEPTVARPHQPRRTPDRRPRTLHRLARRRHTRQRIQPDRLRAQRRRYPLPAQRLVDRRPWASPVVSGCPLRALAVGRAPVDSTRTDKSAVIMRLDRRRNEGWIAADGGCSPSTCATRRPRRNRHAGPFRTPAHHVAISATTRTGRPALCAAPVDHI